MEQGPDSCRSFKCLQSRKQVTLHITVTDSEHTFSRVIAFEFTSAV